MKPVRGSGGRRLGSIITSHIALIAAGGLLVGCSVQVPTDPGGTLNEVRSSSLRVGLSPEPGLVEFSDGEPSGELVELTRGFAQSLGVEPEWTVRSEESLVDMLEKNALDLAVGGFTERSPWSARVGMTRGYPNTPGAEGAPVVILVEPGENAFLSQLERYLDQEVSP